MNKADRIAIQLQAERAAQRHREYVDKMRAQRAEQRVTEQRSALKREQRLAQLREDLIARRMAERPAIAVQKTPGEQPEVPAKSVRPEGVAARQQKSSRAEVKLPSKPTGTEDRRRPSTGYGARLSRRKSSRARSNNAPRLKKERMEARIAARPSRAPRASTQAEPRPSVRSAPKTRAFAAPRTERQSRVHTSDREETVKTRARQAQVRREIGKERVREHQGIRENLQASQEQRGDLRREHARRRNVDRRGFHEQRARREQVRRVVRLRRLEEHVDLRSSRQMAKTRVSALRSAEASRRAEDRQRHPLLAQPRAASRLADTPAPPLYEEPADSLSWLRAANGFLADENGNAVTLRGVTVEGLDGVAPAPGKTVADALALDNANITTLSDLWAFNVVRIPFQPATIVSGTGSLAASDLLAGLDDTINALAEANIYTLFALRVGAPDGPAGTPLPDQSVFDCWNLLAQHYQDEAAVLYEIFASVLPIQSDWLSTAPVLIGTIRQQHPASLLFVGNGSATADTTGLPLRFTTGDPTPNLVYTIRVGTPPEVSFTEENTLSGLAKSFPVFVSDWAGGGASDSYSGAESVANIFARESVGWAAANWNGEPRLVTNAASHNFAPTRWGYTVQRAMALPTREPLTKLLPGENEL
jgi:Cellulase (glycosyl hydrolase family 5)